MIKRRLYAVLVTAAVVCGGVPAQESSAPADWQFISFHFDRPGVQPERYTIRIQSDGKGFYWEGTPDFNPAEVPVASLHQLSVSEATIKKVAASLTTVNTGACESKQKNIAQTGKKTIIVSVGAASPSCEFNYSDDERLNTAAASFQAIAQTFQIGEKLKHDHRFDHLGLDADLDSLTVAAKSGWAIELQNIAPALQSIINDDEMMSPARRKATLLLQMAGVQTTAQSAR
jgi:hypothetical protein